YDWGLLVGKPQIGEHAPFQIEECMALAKTDSVDGNSGCASRDDIKTTDMGQVLKTDRPAEMFHSVKPGCGFLQPRGNGSRFQQEKAALHAVGRHDEWCTRHDQATAQLDHGIIRGNKNQIGLCKPFQRQQLIGSCLDTFKIWNEFRKFEVEACIRACDIFQSLPYALPGIAGIRHGDSMTFNVSLSMKQMFQYCKRQ